MVLANTKIVQAIIEAVNEIADLVVEADSVAQAYKTKYQTLNPDLSGTDLSQAELDAVTAWIGDLNTLANSAVVTKARNEREKSHGTGALG